jgi:transketolase
VAGAYVAALENKHRPTVLILTRQNLPHLAASSIENTLKGAYVVHDVEKPKLVLAATGSEVSLAMETAQLLSKNHQMAVRVVSMPCWNLFEEQGVEYKRSVFPTGVPVLSIEAMSTFGWHLYAHASIGVDTFGASGPYKDVYAKFGLVADQIVPKALSLVEFYNDRVPDDKIGLLSAI